MAPPQSYFDKDTTRFSRFVNLTDPFRVWHDDFSYFGANVYSYLMAKYGEWIDLVSIQLYESYSRAAMAIATNDDISAIDYIQWYIESAEDDRVLRFLVDFSTDEEIELSTQYVYLPISKLVIGLANGWADSSSAENQDKTLFISPSQIQTVWTSLEEKSLLPRGLMFWTLEEEGTRGHYFARDLSRIILPKDDATEL